MRNTNQHRDSKDLYMVVAEAQLEFERSQICVLLMIGVNFENDNRMEHHPEHDGAESSATGLGNVIAIVKVARTKGMEKFRDVVQQARENSLVLSKWFEENWDPAGLTQNWDSQGGLWAGKVLTELNCTKYAGDILEDETSIPVGDTLQPVGSCVIQIVVDGKYVPGQADLYQTQILDLLQAQNQDDD